ncbi:DNA-binding response regulator [Brevirhabdus pacifica]|uniref:DNA-binding response regulator n=2 Tax=Brevirhabdus pacifica TaxID=1267768 RepID=A0A1U7DG10_9RHOB|nr:response regulator transcription factor [Brevirhabdus pacifica]APX88912.1 DNA-binding response regulator [Brevirhabdus pacifica]OWU80141.1 LuxR family transcriptional regulator [Loktanella sp. 22II-4b]PJJ86541.1 LuxR family two component transcriptional regulator [Brevirhabdus pacifica]
MQSHAPQQTDRPLQRALLIDDHPLFCDALSMTLEAVAGITEVETADLLETALDKLREGGRFDVIILDLHLPDVNGLDGLIRLKSLVPQTPVVVVSSMADNRVIGSALRAGAAGFVPKHSQRAIFQRAFDALARGETFVPEGYVDVTAGNAAATSREDAIARLATLTTQQGRILQLICEGKLNKQIAYDLTIAETTVKAHVTAIMRKLGVQSRTQAVLVAQEANFANFQPDSDGIA